MKRFIAKINTRMGFFFLLVFLFWLKTLLAYFADFSLGVTGVFQWFILLINPLATTFFLFGLALYVKKAKIFYPLILLIDIGNTLLLYLNVIYYREFTDFMTVNTMLGYSKVNQGLSGSSLALTEPHDLLFWLDIVIILVLMLMRKIKWDKNSLPKRLGFQVTSLSVLLFGFNLMFAEIDRPQLITRTFDRSYIVKYLGIDPFTIYDGAKTEQTSKMRSSATKSELKNVEKYVKGHYANSNKKYYGIAKGKNVIVIHLKVSNNLIDDKVEGQTVTPFLNSLYHSKSTIRFLISLTKLAKETSDAENMLKLVHLGYP